MKRTAYEMKEMIESGKAILGIELGSTRIKAVVIDEAHNPIASGNHEWENRYENQMWTYSLEDIWSGVQASYQDMKRDVKEKYDAEVESFAAIGFSAMMHGYMAFDQAGELLVPFRTWRNTTTEQAAVQLTELFQYQIPLRWSIAHLQQAILNNEPHVSEISYLTTLAGYIHWKLTGEKVLGVGDASGMFPIDVETGTYYDRMVQQFDALHTEKGFSWKLADILPKVLSAGENAGTLTEEGAKLLDVSGKLKAGIRLCPPEGDAGTGMAATNSVAVRTGNVSAGTSIFAMVTLEKELSKVYPELDLVTTPDGKLVAMAHCNNCTSDLNAWVSLFDEFAQQFGVKIDKNELFTGLFQKAMEGDPDCGGMLSYNYLSGEPVTGFDSGRPLFVRTPESRFNLANFMRMHILSTMAALKIGMDILLKEEKVEIDGMVGHGGLFKTEGVAQNLMAAALNAPVTVMETAGEGGAWGVALLAAYMIQKESGETLAAYLSDRVFAEDAGHTVEPEAKDVEGFETFIRHYKNGLAIERAAVNALP